MTKKEIKQLIIDSDYKNKDVIILWKYQPYGRIGFVEKSVKTANWNKEYNGFNYLVDPYTTRMELFTLNQLVDYIEKYNFYAGFEFKILRADDE